MFGEKAEGQNGQTSQAEGVGGAAISTSDQPKAAEPPQPSKLTAYLGVVRAMQEQITTLWIDPSYQKRFAHHLAETILDANKAGLTREEINAAVQIGEHLGKRQRAAGTPSPSPLLVKQNGAGDTVIYSASQDDPRREPAREGYRRRARRTQMGLHRRRLPQAA
jgi:hypothetical protein